MSARRPPEQQGVHLRHQLIFKMHRAIAVADVLQADGNRGRLAMVAKDQADLIDHPQAVGNHPFDFHAAASLTRHIDRAQLPLERAAHHQFRLMPAD